MGYPIGATGLYITTEDMLKLGILYLNNGVYLGKRYVSEEWVRLVISREYEFHAMTASLQFPVMPMKQEIPQDWYHALTDF